jgi:hypothetical protein
VYGGVKEVDCISAVNSRLGCKVLKSVRMNCMYVLLELKIRKMSSTNRK